MPYVSTRAGQVFHTDQGSGEPVVLLHATLHDHHDFDTVAPPLAERYRVIAIDWPGHGRSDPMPDATGPAFADVLADIVRALDLPPAAIIGSSVGGYAASRLALDAPERVRAVVLVNAAGFTPSNVATRAMCRLVGAPAINRVVGPRLVPRYMRAGNDHDRDITARAIARARDPQGVATSASLWRSFADPRYDLRERASAHGAPTLFVWGTRDIVLPARAGRAAARRLPHAELVELDTGHVVFASAPEPFLAAVEPFLAAAFAAPSLDRAPSPHG
jgi:pimeloyl-ACP methyl ester carboxylesterase